MSTKIGDTEVYTVEELAKLLETTEHTVRRWIKEEKFTATKLGRRYYILAESVEEYLRQEGSVNG
ncbi:MAG: hypothetical protein AVO35_13255 [Candidatus Aegiribacteria sp. MLS_C]|nr:MAG: hypothetical protein AVO35_13255 [Candidatus Aegiribacteria sp. MLS_C]